MLYFGVDVKSVRKSVHGCEKSTQIVRDREREEKKENFTATKLIINERKRMSFECIQRLRMCECVFNVEQCYKRERIK